MIEGFFSKMTKQMLGGIRVESKKELEDRICRYFDEINKEPASGGNLAAESMKISKRQIELLKKFDIL